MTKKLQETVDQNTKDIADIKHSIDVIENYYLAQVAKDMCHQCKKLEKMDARIWWVLTILVVSTVISMIGTDWMGM